MGAHHQHESISIRRNLGRRLGVGRSRPRPVVVAAAAGEPLGDRCPLRFVDVQGTVQARTGRVAGAPDSN